MLRRIVFLHGWTMRGSVFDDLIAHLPGFDCRAPDLPGHGSAADQAPTLDHAAEVAHRLVRQGAGTVVVGWSMGAAVAWRMVELFGTDGLAGLVSVDMSPKIVNDAGWGHGLAGQSAADVARSTARIAADWQDAAQAIAATMFAGRDGAPGFTREAALRQILSNDPGTMQTIWAALTAMDLRAVVPRINCPYLVTHGALSRVYPASAAEWLAASAPNARRHTFTASGHSAHLEEPQTFAAAIRAFAERL